MPGKVFFHFASLIFPHRTETRPSVLCYFLQKLHFLIELTMVERTLSQVPTVPSVLGRQKIMVEYFVLCEIFTIFAIKYTKRI